MVGATLQNIPTDIVFRNVKGQADRGTYTGGTWAAALLAATDNTYDIGATGATRFRDLFLAGSWKEGTVSMNLLPNADTTRDLGASGTRYKDLYLSGEVKGGQVFTLIADLKANDFDATSGTPDNALRGTAGANQYKAWAFSSASDEHIGGPVFTIPQALSTTDVTLDFDIIGAPSANGAAGEEVALNITFAILADTDQGDEARVTAGGVYVDMSSKVTDEKFTARSSPGTSFAAGQHVRVGLWRNVLDARDDYPNDLFILGIKVYAYLKK